MQPSTFGPFGSLGKAPNMKGGLFSRIWVYTSTTTWYSPPNLHSIFLEVLGGGGGGAGANSGGGGGGGGGGYSKGLIFAPSRKGGLGSTQSQLLAQLTPSVTVTIGGGGNGGAAGVNNGSTGGTSSFGSYISCTGGAGGISSTPGAGGAGGVGSGGDLNCNGARGNSSLYFVSVDPVQIDLFAKGGEGASSLYGLGGLGGAFTQTGSNAGGNASVYGSGGGGACSAQGGGSKAGGNGSAGVVIVYEYIYK